MFTPSGLCRINHEEITWQGPTFADIVKVSGNSDEPAVSARLLAVFFRPTPDGAVQQMLVAVTRAIQSVHPDDFFEGITFDRLHYVSGRICYHARGYRREPHIELQLSPISVPAPVVRLEGPDLPDPRVPVDRLIAHNAMAAASTYLLHAESAELAG